MLQESDPSGSYRMSEQEATSSIRDISACEKVIIFAFRLILRIFTKVVQNLAPDVYLLLRLQLYYSREKTNFSQKFGHFFTFNFVPDFNY